METLVQILHKHVGDEARVLRRVHLGVADELTPQLPQLGHVDAPGELHVWRRVKVILRRNRFTCF